METYNYSHFKPAHYTVSDFGGPKAGQPSIEMELFDLDGKRQNLSRYLGKRPVVLETVSLTCPSYVQALPKMRNLQKVYPDVLFLVLYVREAHPGGLTPAHRTLGGKLIAARQLEELHHEERTILVDSLEGTAHQQYGSLPNMVYVFDKEGRVAFRADWNQPDHLAYVLKALTSEDRNLFRRDYFSPLSPSVWSAWKALRIGGFNAIWDFMKGIPSLLKLCKLNNLNYHHRALIGG